MWGIKSKKNVTEKNLKFGFIFLNQFFDIKMIIDLFEQNKINKSIDID